MLTRKASHSAAAACLHSPSFLGPSGSLGLPTELTDTAWRLCQQICLGSMSSSLSEGRERLVTVGNAVTLKSEDKSLSSNVPTLVLKI